MKGPTGQGWEYCHVEFSIWYDALTGTKGVAFQQIGWRRFHGRVRSGGVLRGGRSREEPVIRLPDRHGIPDRHNPIHQSLDQEFVHSLVAAGWQLLPVRDAGWWVRRLGRQIVRIGAR